ALGAVDHEPQVVDGLHARVPDLLEGLLGELGLERQHEPGRGLAGGVGDDVELDCGRGHLRQLSGGGSTLVPCAFWSWTTNVPCGTRSTVLCASKATR